MINNVILVGRLTKDPELKKTQSNISYVRFTLAVNRTFVTESGERETDFISCVAWRNQAENLARFQSKGNQIGIVGRIQTGSYETDNGTVYTTDVIADNIQFLEPKSSNNNNDDNSGYVKDPESLYEEQTRPTSDDDLPF